MAGRCPRSARFSLAFAVLAFGLGTSASASADASSPGANDLMEMDLDGESASIDVQAVARWVLASADNRKLPFAIIDKRNARAFVFNKHGHMSGAAPVLLGSARGDDTVPGIGQRRLASIKAGERTTPAGRFQASLGHDLEQDVLWIDYDSSLSLHRVIVGNPQDRRKERLASPTHLDNRISYGCINVPAAFYDRVVVPAFTGTVGIVYILPENTPVSEMFPADPALP